MRGGGKGRRSDGESVARKKPTDGLRIEYLPLSGLLRAPRNPKGHDLGALHQSMARFGYVAPVILDEASGRLVAGHGRLDALQQAKAAGKPAPERVQVRDGEWLVPVIRGVAFDNPTEAEAYLVADNRLTDLGGWNDAELAKVLSDLAAQDALAGTGYDADDLDALLRDLGQGGQPVEEDVPPDPTDALLAKWDVKLGDLWEAGEHRVLCGDGTTEESLRVLLRDEAVDLFITDPPYASGGLHIGDRQPGATEKYKQTGTRRTYLDFSGDSRDQRSWMAWVKEWLVLVKRRAKPRTYVMVFIDWRQLPALTDVIQAAGWLWRGVNVWDKGEGARMPHMGYFRAQAEFIVWGTAGKLPSSYDRAEVGPGVFTCSVDSEKVHLTQKPVSVLEWLLTVSDPSQLILDIFGGSGTTLVAAHAKQCLGRMAEIEPRYVAVTLERMSRLGLTPKKVAG